jgi:rare lipoprotein A
MTPTPRSRTLTHRAAQVGLVSGLTLATAALVVPHGHAAPPAPHVTVAAQTAAQPVTVTRGSAARASRSRGLAQKHLPMKQVVRTVPVGASFSGQASWYGGSFQGQRTANGEHFDTNAYTAASKTLSFGTRLRVCHAGCVIVRVNDRGPYVGGRILDLSRAAANAIGYSGVAYVTATPVGERTVAVLDTVALARQRADTLHATRHAAKVARSHQRRALALARAAALRQAAVQRERAAAPVGQLDQHRAPAAAAGGMLSVASGGVLRLRRRRP